MSIALFNRALVAVSCEITPQGHVLSVSDDRGLQHTLDVDETVLVELVAPGLSDQPEAVVTIDAVTRDAYVWEETSAGLVQWARDANGYAYRFFVAPADATIQVVTLPAGSPPPDAPSPPGSGQAILRLKVRRAGDLPLMSKEDDLLRSLESKRTQPRYRVSPHTAALRPGFEHANFNKLADELDAAALLERISRPKPKAP